jgi:hypothetical protein
VILLGVPERKRPLEELDIGLYSRIISKQILKYEDVTMWTGLILHGIVVGGGLL